jgi:hypothetical protein
MTNAEYIGEKKIYANSSLYPRKHDYESSTKKETHLIFFFPGQTHVPYYDNMYSIICFQENLLKNILGFF